MNFKSIRVSAIVAVGKNNEMGVGNDKLPWDIPEDAKFYRDKTRFHVNVMGRTTYESLCDVFHGIPANRVNVVITRQEGYDPSIYPQKYGEYRKQHPLKDIKFEGVAISFTGAKEAINYAKNEEIKLRDRLNDGLEPEVFVVGGSQIFTLCMQYTDRLYITKIDAEFPQADVFAPEFSEFTKVIEEKPSSDKNYSYTFKTLERK